VIAALILLPAVAGGLAFAVRPDRPRRLLLVATALANATLIAVCWVEPPGPMLDGWLVLDPLGLLFVTITGAVFLAASLYGVSYLARESGGRRTDFAEGIQFSNAPESVMSGCLLLFLSTMSLVCVSHHFGLLWVAIEATTLASAPLIYFHRQHRSLEAAWKYLLICSVGIALALLGNFFLAVAASRPGGHSLDLDVASLIDGAGLLNAAWLKASFLFLIVGYGTKMGLAPMHTWLPDAHSEAPSLVSALLSGALLNCAFLGILRAQQVLDAAGYGAFGRDTLLAFGLVSMGFAAIFILNQADYKRMLAYSSVEHMGILAIGVGLGGSAVFGAMLHAVNHSLAKGMLFLVAGNILSAYRTKSTGLVHGVGRVLPVSGVLWIAGFLAVTGTPPFGPFLSKITILKAALDQGREVIAAAYLVLIGLVFVGMAGVVLNMLQGLPPENEKRRAEPALSIAPPIALGVALLLLGLYLPSPLRDVLQSAARALGGH